MINEKLIDIARSGVMAPSADNKHVFQIEFGEHVIRLWPTKEFAETVEPHRRMLGMISLGAVVENMVLRAGELGLDARRHWSIENHMGPIVQLDLEVSSAAKNNDLAKAIPLRHTNRRMYRGPNLSDQEIAQLTSCVNASDVTQILWLKGEARRRALSLIWQAESERFLQENLHKELFSSIRFDLPWDQTADRALPPGSLEIEPIARPLFKALRHWKLMRQLNKLGIYHLIGLRAGWLPAWQAPTLGLITTSLSTEAGAISAGEAFERLWLRATLLNLAVQPLAASTVLSLGYDSGYGASKKMSSYLNTSWQAIAPGTRPVMIFRMGHASPPKIRTSRQSIEKYFRD